jgi:hypothetical protein
MRVPAVKDSPLGTFKVLASVYQRLLCRSLISIADSRRYQDYWKIEDKGKLVRPDRFGLPTR